MDRWIRVWLYQCTQLAVSCSTSAAPAQMRVRSWSISSVLYRPIVDSIKGLVEGVADSADGGGHARVGQRFAEADGGVLLAAGVGVVDQPGGGEPAVVTPPGEQGQFEVLPASADAQPIARSDRPGRQGPS